MSVVVVVVVASFAPIIPVPSPRNYATIAMMMPFVFPIAFHGQ
jgi:hypothetical protein